MELSTRIGFTVLMAAATSLTIGCQSLVGGAALTPVRDWHDSYLVLSNVGSMSIYAMSASGTFKVYRPSYVDANQYPCQDHELKDGYWCVDAGRLYKSESRIVARTKDGTDTVFYLDPDGNVCAPPDENESYDGQCESEGYAEAMGYFAVYPRR